MIKWSQQRGSEDVMAVGSINYIAAAVFTLPAFLIYNPIPVSTGALWTGASLGSCYFIGYLLVIRAIHAVGASTTSVVSVLSILMPIVAAAMFFEEIPTTLQSAGIGLALASLLMIGGNRQPTKCDESSEVLPIDESSTTAGWIVPAVLVSFFLVCGVIRMAQDAFNHVSDASQQTAFCLVAFTIASIPSLFVLLRNRRWPTSMEWGTGVLLGLSNVLQTYFILRALEHLAGYIVFTLASGGSILLTTAVATGLMGERLNRRTQIGIAMAVVALVLLRWLPA